MTSKRCTFCEIIAGHRKGYTVFEDPTCLALLDRRPLFYGHCLLVPKEHYPTLIELPSSLVPPLFINAQLLAQAVEIGQGAEGSFVAINNRISQSVPHLHIHIVPRRRKDGLRGFFWPRHPYPEEGTVRQVQADIQRAIAQLKGSLEQ